VAICLIYRRPDVSVVLAWGEFVSDIFHEVDEEIRRERLKRLWDRWGNFILAAAVLLVVAVAGWRAWEWREHKRAQEAGAAFETALDLARTGKHDEAEAKFAELAKGSPQGYRTLALFSGAAELAVRDPAGAVRAYDAIAADGQMGQTLRDLAAVRAGLLLLDSASYADLQARLEPASAADRPFRHTARELLAVAAWRSGDLATARRWIDMIMADNETPSGTRSRVEMLMALADADGKS
jgi:hypothetical protein